VTPPRIVVAAGKVAFGGIVGTIAFLGCMIAAFLTPVIMGLLIEGLFSIGSVISTAAIARTGLTLVVASFSAWLFHVSPGSLLLAWIVATMISAVVGGFIGAFLGCVSATYVLQKARDRLEA